MAVILPIISLLLLILVGSKLCQKKREALLVGLMAWAILVTFLTEMLSLFGSFNLFFLTVAWLMVTVGLSVFCLKVYGSKWLVFSLKHWLNIETFIDLPFVLKLSTIGVVVTLLGIGITALVAAPNHSDSMEYHLSRVMHWIQQGGVAHYPSHTIFQLYQNPWSEFAIAHLEILSRSDRFDGCIQWVSMIGSIFGVSLIAKELGAQRSGQILAAVFCATIPMGILQGSSTNNDHVVALWMVCFVYFLLVTTRLGIRPIPLLGLGVSLGLAILTKGTAYIYAFPFCIWLLLWGIQRLRWQVWKPIVGVLAIAVAINTGHYARNWALFGSPLGLPGDETGAAFGLKYLISNVVRNLALHADIVRNLHLEGVITPTTGLTEKAITTFHDVWGGDVSDPLITSPKSPRFFVPGLSFNEDKAGNPLHLLLIFAASGLLLINVRLKQRRRLLIYGLTAAGAFVLFCQLLTWSPSRCRLHLPIFILFSALVGTILAASLNRRLVSLLAVVLVPLSFQWVLFNQVRPLMGEENIFTTPRIDQYFKTQPVLKAIYTGATTEIKRQACSNIGLVFENISYEYPYWVLLKAPDLEMQHVNVTNESAPLSTKVPDSEVQPCLVMQIASRGIDAPLEPEMTVGNQSYQSVWSQTENTKTAQKSVQLFKPS